MSKIYKSNERYECEKLQELALHFFKQGNYSAAECYEHALSFLSISKNCNGADIEDFTISYNSKKDGSVLLVALKINSPALTKDLGVIKLTLLGNIGSSRDITNSLIEHCEGLIAPYIDTKEKVLRKPSLVVDSSILINGLSTENFRLDSFSESSYKIVVR